MKTFRKGICILFINGIISFFIDVSTIKANHFNLITTNSVLTGFLLTSLSMMLGFLNETIVQFFEEAGALKKVYNNIQRGIFSSLLSITMSIINAVIFEKYAKSQIILNFLYSLEVLLLVFTLYYLFCTINNLKIIVNSIKFDKMKKKSQKNANEELNNLLNEENKI